MGKPATPPPAADLEGIPHLEARRILDKHFHGGDGDIISDERRAATAQVDAKITAARKYIAAVTKRLEAKLLAGLVLERNKIEEPFQMREAERWENLEADLKLAGVEFEDFRLHDDYCGVYCCSVTGLPMLKSDKVGGKSNGGAYIIRPANV
jgi:hypothetical protein